MEFDEVLQNRISVRSYNGKPVEKEKLDAIFKAMQLAPSTRHLEAYRVHVIDDEDVLVKLATLKGQEDRVRGVAYGLLFYAVPSEVEVKSGEHGKRVFVYQDVALACSYAQLKATDLGLATLWMGGIDLDYAKTLVDDERFEPVTLLLIGHTDEEPERVGRKELKDLLV